LGEVRGERKGKKEGRKKRKSVQASELILFSTVPIRCLNTEKGRKIWRGGGGRGEKRGRERSLSISFLSFLGGK